MVQAESEKDYPFWQLVAKSYRIVEGTLDVPVADIQQAGQSGDHDYVQVNVTLGKTLKGKAESQVFNFRYYTDTEQYGGVSRQKIISLNGKSATVFLQNVKEKYYLAAYVPETLQFASAALADRVRKEVSVQEKLIEENEKISLAPWWPDAHEGLVHYGPETVTDALSVALMALTNEDLTAIYNGGTELERQQAVRIWKIYERRTYGKPITR